MIMDHNVPGLLGELLKHSRRAPSPYLPDLARLTVGLVSQESRSHEAVQAFYGCLQELVEQRSSIGSRLEALEIAEAPGAACVAEAIPKLRVHVDNVRESSADLMNSFSRHSFLRWNGIVDKPYVPQWD